MNVTECVAVPASGAVSGIVKAKLPTTLPTPPLKVAFARVCPEVIALAAGSVVMAGVALATVTLTFAVAEWWFDASLGVKVTS